MANRKTTRPISVAGVCDVLDQLAPLRLAQSWDNVGLLAGHRGRAVRRILVCIDLMPAVVSEAIKRRCDMIVAYHPPIFRPITRLVRPSDGMEAQIVRCLSRGIAVYSPHTALDAAAGGTNDVLASLCGATQQTPLEPSDGDPSIGMGRIGELPANTTLQSLARALKRRTKARCVSIVGDRVRVVRRAIVVVGAAGDLPFKLELGKHDVIVTGEMRHHDALRVQRVGCSAVALSHWSSERPALASFTEQLGHKLAGVETLLSERDAEPFVRL